MEPSTAFDWAAFAAELAQQQSDNNTFELNWNELVSDTKLLALLFERNDTSETDL